MTCPNCIFQRKNEVLILESLDLLVSGSEDRCLAHFKQLLKSSQKWVDKLSVQNHVCVEHLNRCKTSTLGIRLAPVFYMLCLQWNHFKFRSRGTIHVLCAMVQRSGRSTCGRISRLITVTYLLFHLFPNASQGFPFHSGGLGVEVCSLDVVQPFATVRNRPQPLV